MKTDSILYQNYIQLSEDIDKLNLALGCQVLIQIFCGKCEKEFIIKVRDELVELLPQAKILGTTTAGGIFKGKSASGACIISLTAFHHSTIRTTGVHHDGSSGFRSGQIVARKLLDEESKVLILFGDPFHSNGEEILRGVDSVNQQVPIVGGLASNEKDRSQNFVFTETEILENGLVGASLQGEKLIVFSHCAFDWRAIGRPMEVTVAQSSRIDRIENYSPVEIYEKYLGKEVACGLPQTGLEFPLMVERNGLMVSRAVVGVLPNGGILCNGEFAPGDKVRFGYFDMNRSENSLLEILELARRYPVESVFVYSCFSRLGFIRNLAEKDLAALQQRFPLNGFFSSGEFATIENKRHFLSHTLSLLCLSEDENAIIQVDKKIIGNSQGEQSLATRALHNLIHVTTEELNALNKKLEDKVERNTSEMREQLYLDSLTQLPNRLRLLEDIGFTYLPKLAIINVDAFRQINDYFGHEAGDTVLKELGNRIEQVGKSVGLKVYRLPSDEYSILGDHTLDTLTFVKHLEKMVSVVEGEYFHYQEQEMQINITIGMVSNEESVLEKANMALNYAKKNKISVQSYNEDLMISQNYEKNIRWNKKVLEAVHDDRIMPYFQPLYNNHTGKIEKYEALIRLLDEDNQVVGPFHFLESVKKTRLYPNLTRIVIEKTFAVFRETNYEFSINLSVEDIRDEATRKLIRKKLEERSIATQAVFEILESEGIDEYEEISEFVKEVQGYGAKVAIDDFGSGYSNFAHLMNLDVNYIKIDGSMIKNIDTDCTAQTVVETLVQFARKLGMQTVAEFVHSEGVYQKVKELGVDFSQGYYIGQPSALLHTTIINS